LGLFSSVLKVGTSFLAGKSAKKATKAAQAAQLAAIQQAMGTLNTQYGQAQEDYAPYQEAGVDGLTQLMTLLGLSGDTGGAIEGLKNNPVYQSLFNNGQNTLLANASATGGLRGGNTSGALANFGRDTLANVYQQQVGNLGGLTTMGYNATSGLSSLGANNAAAIAALFGQQGDVNAGASLQRGAINSNMWNTVGTELGSIADTIQTKGLKGLF